MDLEQTQKTKWNSKYDNLPSNLRNKYSREIFLWAMEAVHSRSFCGDFGPTVSIGRAPVLASGLVQLIAIVFGVQSLLVSTPKNDTDGIVLACTLIAVLPILILNFFISSGEGVLLPMIDSANHLAEAKSKIEYDPFQDGFSLKLGDKCVGNDGQVFITYGENKSDSELLLNYGFIPGVSFDDVEADSDKYRSEIASAFVARN